MSASLYDIKIEQGADFELELTLQDEAGAAINVTGAIVRSMVRQSYETASPLITMIGTVVDGPTGQVKLEIPAATTSALDIHAVTTCVYDMEVVLTTGKVIRVLEGKAIFSPEVTR